MKRLLIICMTLAMLLACVPTPEEEFVVNKGDGQLEELIGQATPAQSYDSAQTLRTVLGIPETVEETFETQVYGGTLYVSVEANVTAPEVSAVPVFSATIGWGAMKDLKEIVHALLGDEIYRVNSARATVISSEHEIARYNAWLADLNAGKPHTDLSAKQEREWLEQNLSAALHYLNLYRDRAYEPVLWDGSFEPYEGDYGDVNLYSEPYLMQIHPSDSTILYVAFRDLNHVQAGPDACRAPEEQDAPAIAAAQTFLSALSDAPLEVFALNSTGGITAISIAPVYDGVPCLPLRYDNGDDTGYDAVNGDSFARNMRQEVINLSVQDGAVTYLEWENPLYITGVENENVVLMPFDEIMELFRSHIRATYYLNYDEKTGEGAYAKLHITSIRLSYMRVDKKDSDDYYLLPVWDFCGYDEYYGTENDPQAYAEFNRNMELYDWNSTYITVNAIDGSIIDRNSGY